MDIMKIMFKFVLNAIILARLVMEEQIIAAKLVIQTNKDKTNQESMGLVPVTTGILIMESLCVSNVITLAKPAVVQLIIIVPVVKQE